MQFRPALEPEVAALLEPLACCLRGVERAAIAAGDSVAILGAGPIGLMLSACVADAGGWPVIVGGREERRELVSAFGAEPGDGRGADVVLEAAGTEQAWSDAVELVRPGGTVVMFGGLPRDARPPVDAFRLHYDELDDSGLVPPHARDRAGGAGLPRERRLSVGPPRHPSRVVGRTAGALRRSAARPAQGRRHPVTLRELNRTLLLRQLLLDRKRIPLVKTVTRLVALQAQYAPSPYVALWSRIEGFRKEQLTRALSAGSIVKAGSLRTTLHVMSAAEFPFLASAYVESERGRTEGLGVDVEVLRAALPDEPITERRALRAGPSRARDRRSLDGRVRLSRAAVRAHRAGR